MRKAELQALNVELAKSDVHTRREGQGRSGNGGMSVEIPHEPLHTTQNALSV